ncbi:MAG TPA: Smr/MutS family protein [Deltaproteobacteria bacterium]|jgi:DNA-nicking Smr family endonuclease|nr:Smr/MutS family protein [Deltaproteobacteria bacterium]
MAKREEPFHGPFKKLKGLKVRKKEERQSPAKPVPKPRPEPDDEELFQHAMKGVRPMSNDSITPEPVDPKALLASVQESLRRQDQEVVDALYGLVKGTDRFDVSCTGEYLEGHVIPMDPATMKKLKEGELTIESHLDLHGYTKQAAEAALISFILNSHAMGHRVVLVIHGRGLKSSQGPVLKEHLVRWLTTGSLSHLILAFCSARPCDGGTGALYVLLKRQPRKSRWKRPL